MVPMDREIRLSEEKERSGVLAQVEPNSGGFGCPTGAEGGSSLARSVFSRLIRGDNGQGSAAIVPRRNRTITATSSSIITGAFSKKFSRM